MTTVDSTEIRVLHVDDEPDVVELTAAYLEEKSERFAVRGETNAEDALSALETETFDCIVSDYEMPGTDGLEFLEAVREHWPRIPFILFTGQGSESVAGAAISAGVTDYMQKRSGTGQYDLLANRIENAVDNYRTRHRHDRQHRAIETAREGIAILDDQGRFASVNRAYAELYGYEPEEMIGEHWELVSPDEAADRTYDEILPTVEREGRWRGERVGLDSSGETFVEDHTLARTGDGGFVCTVRESDAHEEGGERPDDRVGGFSSDTLADGYVVDEALLVEHAADMIHFVDTDGVVQYANPAASEMTGYDRDDLVGSHVSLLMDDDGLEKARGFIRDRLSAWPEEQCAEFAWTLHTADGDELLCDSNVRLVFVDGEWRGLVGVVRDVSDRIERERLFRERTEEVERQNEQLETLASVISHDLRNPMNVAMGRLRIAREEHESEHLADVASALERILEIIEDTQTLVSEWQTVEETSELELDQFVAECWENIATSDASIEVADELRIMADGRRLRNLLENLLGNAVEHGGPGASVRVGALPDGFYVEDDGPGVPEGDRDDVFDAGHSTREGGTGLGLHIVSTIASAHDWDVCVRESDAGGARFEVTGVDVVTD